MSMRHGIQDLLQTVEVSEFAATYSGKQVLHVNCRNDALFDRVRSEVNLFERLADTTFFKRAHVLMRQDEGGPLQRQARNASEARTLFRKGYSVMLRNFHRLLSPPSIILDIARSIEREFGHPLHSMTCFCSPPSARSMQPHTDPYDVYTLQLLGAKRWSFFGPATGSKADGDPGGAAERSLIVEQGDMLYVPAAHRHVVESLDDVSLSLALVVEPLTTKDFIEVLLDSSSSLRGLQSVLPAQYWSSNRPEAINLVTTFLQSLSDAAMCARADRLIDVLAGRTIFNRPTGSTVDLRDAVVRLKPDTVICANRPLEWSSSTDGTGLSRLWFAGGRTVTIPTSLVNVVENLLLRGNVTRVSDIAPDLTSEEKEDLVQIMLDAGVVRIARCRFQ
jgi:hypothetical protein